MDWYWWVVAILTVVYFSINLAILAFVFSGLRTGEKIACLFGGLIILFVLMARDDGEERY